MRAVCVGRPRAEADGLDTADGQSDLLARGAENLGPGEDDSVPSDYAITVEELNLSVRSYNCLKREGINTVGDLVEKSEAEPSG